MERSEKREEIKLVIEYIKIIISLSGVAAIVFAAMQWMTQNSINKDATDRHLMALWRDHAAVLVEKPEFWPYFEEKLPIKAVDEKMKRQILAYADLRLDIIDDIYGVAEDTWDSDEIDIWLKSFRSEFKTSIVLCERYQKNVDQYYYITNFILKDQIGSGLICEK